MNRALIILALISLVPISAPAQTALLAPPASPVSPRDALPFTNDSLTALNPNLPTLFFVGDATVSLGSPRQRGWGAVVVDYFDASKINLCNRGMGYASFPSYYVSRWKPLIKAVKPGDFVVIELGHNRGHLDGTGPETRTAQLNEHDPATGVVHTYGWYVRTFISDIRTRGGIPIISSPTTRNVWTNTHGTFDGGKLTRKEADYNPADDRVERGLSGLLDDGRPAMTVWAGQVADEENAVFIDHGGLSADAYEKMGREAVQKFFPADYTHTNTDGAVLNAQTFVAGINARPDIPLGDFLNEKGHAIPPDMNFALHAGAGAVK